MTDLMPNESLAHEDVDRAIESMREMPKITGISDDMLSEWIAEGRG